MPLITGTIADSTGTPLSGTLYFQVLQPTYLQETSTILLPAVHEFPITAGVVSITVEPAPYQVTFKDTLDVELWQIKTTIGAQDTTIDALPGIVLEDRYTSALARLAHIIVNQYADQITLSFNSMGEWDPDTIYTLNDMVSYLGSSYVYVDPAPSSGSIPTSNGVWALLAEKGETGVGTSGSDIAFGPSWDGSLDAASKNALYDVLSTLAPIDSPSLTGTPTAPLNLDINDSSTQIATNAWVQLGRLNGPGIKWLTNQTMRVVADPYSFKLAWGFYTTPSITWTAGTEETFEVFIPDTFTIDNQRAIVATIKGITGSTGIFQVRAQPGATNDRFILGIQMELDNNFTGSITVSWFMAGA